MRVDRTEEFGTSRKCSWVPRLATAYWGRPWISSDASVSDSCSAPPSGWAPRLKPRTRCAEAARTCRPCFSPAHPADSWGQSRMAAVCYCSRCSALAWTGRALSLYRVSRWPEAMMQAEGSKARASGEAKARADSWASWFYDFASLYYCGLLLYKQWLPR